jgi:hypothetical protein
MIRNWVVKPDFMAYRGAASDTALVDANDFVIWIRFADWEAKRGAEPWDIHVDTVRVKLLPSGVENSLWGSFVGFRSHPSSKYVEKSYSLYGPDFKGDPEWQSDFFEIPRGIDSVLVELTAFLRPGALTSKSRDGYSLQWDFIEVDESAPVDTVVTSFKMYRSVTSQKTWKLFNDAMNKD